MEVKDKDKDTKDNDYKDNEYKDKDNKENDKEVASHNYFPAFRTFFFFLGGLKILEESIHYGARAVKIKQPRCVGWSGSESKKVNIKSGYKIYIHFLSEYKLFCSSSIEKEKIVKKCSTRMTKIIFRASWWSKKKEKYSKNYNLQGWLVKRKKERKIFKEL